VTTKELAAFRRRTKRIENNMARIEERLARSAEAIAVLKHEVAQLEIAVHAHPWFTPKDEAA
jgi:hypothetical protein